MPFLDRASNSRPINPLLWDGDGYRSGNPRENGLDGTGLPAALVQAQRHLCGNVDCSNGWTLRWRSRRRPVFEDRWGCSGRCVLTMVREALRREGGAGKIEETGIPHRHRVPLGLLMLAQGWITHRQLRQALDAQSQNGTGRIGEWLIAECGIEAEQITRGLSMQWNCPVLDVKGFSPNAMALVMPRVVLEKFGLLPLRLAGRRILYLAFENRPDASVSLAVEQMTGLKAESGILSEIQFRDVSSGLLQCNAVETKLESISNMDTLAGRMTAILEQKQPVGSRLVRLHQYYWMRLWMESGTTGNAGTIPVSPEDMMDYVFTIGL